VRNPANLNLLANRQVGEGPQVEPALSAIFRIVLRASLVQEFLAADYVIKSFCEVRSHYIHVPSNKHLFFFNTFWFLIIYVS
jgi:hypothetical protein